MTNNHWAFIFAVMIVVFFYSTDVAARTGNSRGKKKTDVSREYTAREHIDRLERALSRLSYAMDDYDFDKIHWHLYTVYECYSRLDTLSGAVKRPAADTTLSVITDKQARKMWTQAFIDSFIVQMERTRTKDATIRKDSLPAPVRPVVMQKKDTAVAVATNLENALFNPLKARGRDSGAMVIVKPPEKQSPHNIVEYEVAKLKEKTADIHRYFDAGEFSMSRTELEWLKEYLSGVKMKLINYIASLQEDPAHDSLPVGE
ncbi:MAG: hypothetical protein JW863_20125 [Chitinispirillaceae bacterium]|nr:hypothetical protein [Chitinispirillaceae bacterium]